ncbi:META domain-containing protein [Solicola gregarius]|uniref:META domain-containing protein n=1 Tax=Solicola gregarius TaxID=2908642 RepID=A0AA46TEH1_9ACTN|nr:META domain-containing protein [Solicola gregarius]UYM03745.1 META domain-containing protein [Solicola gregarius]
MNTQLKDLYRQAGDAVEPTGDVTQALTSAQRRRVRSQVATPIASVAVVAGAVGLAVGQPWADDPATDVAGADSAAGFGASLPDPVTVAGNTYVLDDAESSGLPKKADVEISFEKGTYSASAGCNTFNGRYDMSDDVLVSSSMGQTMAFCPGRAGSDAWLESFLDSGPQVSIDGDRLNLDNGESDVALAVESIDDKSLAGTRWQLDSIVSGDVVSSAPQGRPATLSYDGSDELAVSTGCSTETAEVDVSSDAIQVTGDSAGSSANCAASKKAVDRSVREVLDGSVGYEIDGAQLRIKTKDGALVYTAN